MIYLNGKNMKKYLTALAVICLIILLGAEPTDGSFKNYFLFQTAVVIALAVVVRKVNKDFKTE